MPEPTTFEARLGSQLQAYAEGGVRPIDRYAVAESTIAAGARRGLGDRLGALRPAGIRLAPRVFLALLALLALALALWVAGRQQSAIPPGRLAFIQDGDVYVADSDTSNAVKVLDDPVVDFERVTVLPDSDLLAVESNGILAILDLTTGERHRIGQVAGGVTWDDHGGYAYVAPRPEPGPAAIVVGDALAVGSAAAPREVTPDGPVSDVLALSPDGRWLATVLDGTFYRIDTTTGSTTAIGQIGQGDISFNDLAWAPDSSRVVFVTLGYGSCVVGEGCIPGAYTLYLLDAAGGGLRRLTDPESADPSTVNGSGNLGSDSKSRWSPDGQWIAFRSATGLSIVRPDGTGHRDLVTRPVGWFDWAPDSSGLEFVANEAVDDATGELSWVSLADGAPRSLGRGKVRWLALGSSIPDTGAVPPVVAATEAPGAQGGSGSVVSAPVFGAPVDPSGAWSGLLFTSEAGGCQSVFRVDFDDPTVRPSAPDGCYQRARISPDGRRIAIGGTPQRADGTFDGDAEGRVAIVDLHTGGATVARPGAPDDQEGLGPTIDLLTWSPGGRWLAWDIAGETWILSADAATSRRLPSGGWPQWSPDDTQVAVETRDEELVVGTADGADMHVAGPAGTTHAWSGGAGRYAFIRDGDAWLANGDGSDLRNLTGFEFGGAWATALSPDGETLAVVQQARVLWLITRDGTRRQVDLGPEASLEYVDLRWTPDGTRLAVAARPSYESTAGTLYLVARDGAPTVMVADALNPVWSPDGRYLAFQSSNGGARIDVMNADGSGRRTMTDDTVDPDGQIGWQPRP